MAVYTTPTYAQLRAIAKGLGYTYIDAVPEERGTNDSKFVVTLHNGPGSEQVVAMLSIIETPDVHQNGTDAEQAKYLPELLNHIRKNSPVYDHYGNKVNFSVPSPLLFEGRNAYVIMACPSQQGQGLVEKVVHVVPYINGKCPKHQDNIPQGLSDAAKLGAAQAAWQKAANDYPEPEKLKNSFPIEEWPGHINQLTSDPEVPKKLAAKMQEAYRFVGESALYWEQRAQAQLIQLSNAVEYITSNWEERTSDMPEQITHGDPFPDNCIITKNGIVSVVDNGTAHFGVNTDIAMGLNATAMNFDGKLHKFAAAEFLQAYNNVKPLSEAEKETLEFLGQYGAIRWALSRVMSIAKTENGRTVNTRLPDALFHQYEFWHEAELSGRKIADELLDEGKKKQSAGVLISCPTKASLFVIIR